MARKNTNAVVELPVVESANVETTTGETMPTNNEVTYLSLDVANAAEIAPEIAAQLETPVVTAELAATETPSDAVLAETKPVGVTGNMTEKAAIALVEHASKLAARMQADYLTVNEMAETVKPFMADPTFFANAKTAMFAGKGLTGEFETDLATLYANTEWTGSTIAILLPVAQALTVDKGKKFMADLDAINASELGEAARNAMTALYNEYVKLCNDSGFGISCTFTQEHGINHLGNVGKKRSTNANAKVANVTGETVTITKGQEIVHNATLKGAFAGHNVTVRTDETNWFMTVYNAGETEESTLAAKAEFDKQVELGLPNAKLKPTILCEYSGLLDCAKARANNERTLNMTIAHVCANDIKTNARYNVYQVFKQQSVYQQ